jgi:hypothetical protein
VQIGARLSNQGRNTGNDARGESFLRWRARGLVEEMGEKKTLGNIKIDNDYMPWLARAIQAEMRKIQGTDDILLNN